MPAQIYVGTSGYSYADWVGPFYPEGMQKKEFLSFYASRFSLVELNFSYYRQPDGGLIDHLAETTPQSFLFTIKAHRSLTHEVSNDWKKDAGVYKDGIAPLIERNRLSAVLCQFPFSFHYTTANRRYLAELCELLESLPLVLEFRNQEWQTEPVVQEMRKRGIGYAAADYPELKGLPKSDSVTTAPTGYVRFHGRNKENWWNGNNASRYDYLYEEEELSGWLDRISEMSENTRMLIIVFNNHWRGKAVHNAKQLKSLIQKQTTLHVV